MSIFSLCGRLHFNFKWNLEEFISSSILVSPSQYEYILTLGYLQIQMVKFSLLGEKDGLASLLVIVYICACVCTRLYKQKHHNEITNKWVNVEYTISGFWWYHRAKRWEETPYISTLSSLSHFLAGDIYFTHLLRIF